MSQLTLIRGLNQKSAAFNGCSKLDIQNIPVIVNILAFFYLKIGNFWSFIVSDLIVITLKPAPVVLPRKSEVVGKGLIS